MGIAIRHWILATLVAAAAPAGAETPPAPSPYAGQQERRIKALSEKEVEDLLAGRGMGLAKSAELNSYPGPLHVLELRVPLGLSAGQQARTQRLLEEMQEQAIALGREIVAREAGLERLFASRRITHAALASNVADIARLQGELRRVHLEAHLAQAAILTSRQVAAYAELRGYGGNDPAAGHRHH